MSVTTAVAIRPVTAKRRSAAFVGATNTEAGTNRYTLAYTASVHSSTGQPRSNGKYASIVPDGMPS